MLATRIEASRTWRENARIVTVTVTPRPPIATAHAFSLPVVREIPPVQRPGTFDTTW
jgi:hypothetical protein